MPSRDFTRSDRISAELRRLLGAMVHEAVRDNALPSVSVSDVEVTRDFDFATVFVTALQPETSKDAVKALNEMAKEFRRELSKVMRMRRVPELRFKYDDSVDRGARIDELLRADPGFGTGDTGLGKKR
ncbi:MAG TPA: 30S ribosome-binding factor RbfA [Rudaea sp.]|jgi:ribosome-binding factor A